MSCTLYGYPGVSLAAGTPVAQIGDGGLAVAGRGARGGRAGAGEEWERAAAGHPGGGLPVGDVLAEDDHLPADLPAGQTAAIYLAY